MSSGDHAALVDRVNGRLASPDPGEPKYLLTIADLCERLSLGRSTIYQLLGANTWPVIRVGKSVRVRASDVEAWLERHATAVQQG